MPGLRGRGVHVVLCDDRRLLRESLGRYLEDEPGIAEVDLLEDGDGAVRATRAGGDVLVLALGHTGDTDAFEVLEAMRNLRADAAVLVVAPSRQIDALTTAVALGATGICRDDVDPARLYDAVQLVAQGKVVIPEDLVSDVLRGLGVKRRKEADDRRRLDSLTDRERDVLRLLARGLSRADIALRLGVSQHTVRTHVGNLMRKLGVHTQLAAAVRAAGLLVDDAALPQH